MGAMRSGASLSGSLSMRWLGVAGLELHAGGQTLAIDPFLTRPSIARVAFTRLKPDIERIRRTIPACDHILVTHAHYDHLLDVPALARQTRATVWGSEHTCRICLASGVPQAQVRRVAPGDRLVLGQFRVEVLPATHERLLGRVPFAGPLRDELHPPLRASDYRMDVDLGFWIEVEGLSFLDWLGLDVEGARSADVLLVKPDRSRVFFERLLGIVSPRLVIPMHWDDFFRPVSQAARPSLGGSGRLIPPLQRVDLRQFERWLAEIEPGARVRVPRAFEAFELDAP